MIKFPNLKCPICGKSYKQNEAFGNHMRTEHPGTIPEGWSDLRYAYFVYTGKDRGHCRECGGETPWNEVTGSYAKICGSEICKKKFRDRVMAGMRARYGKTQGQLLADPKYRERMLTHRKISGEYKFHDGGSVAYMGSLEKEFLKMLDNFFRFPSADIMSPSPNRYRYYYENPNDVEHEGEHWYVPDFFIPSCNLEIELKAGNNQRPKNLMIDVRKDAAKDIAMVRNPLVNYIKIYETDYHVFFQVFADLASQQIGNGPKKPIKYISRTLLNSVYRDYIPDDCLAILDQYIYKYSEKSVLKQPANEAESVYIEDKDEGLDEEQEDTGMISADDYYREDLDEGDAHSIEDLQDQDTVGVNPMMYYQLDAYKPMDSASAEESILNIFSFDSMVSNFSAMESLRDQVDSNKIDGRAALKYRTWKEKLFGSGFLGQKVTSAFTKVTIENGKILIKGINCNLLLYRIKETFSEGKLKYIFEYRYNEKSWKLYQKKKIGRGDMKIDYVYAPEFFCIELVELFQQLAERYRDSTYKTIAQQIYEKSWMHEADNAQVPTLSLDPLKNIDNVELMDHQKLFIEKWPQLKHQLHLRGYILAFQPGKGKTLTAVGLSECIKAKKVYVVCPNNLKDNWVLELKKYYSKYTDEKLWLKDICILGTSYGDPKTAKWLITNNENIKLMMPYAQKDPDSMIILDESHNFRNYSGTRSAELFKLVDTIGSENVLCVSATPIKAVPAEIAPALRLIDPTFNDEAAEMYTKCFDLSTTMAMGIVNKRFGKIIYRPADVEVDLPPKNIGDLPLHVKNGEERFYLDTVHDEVIQDYKTRHEAWLKDSKQASDQFIDLVLKYSMVSRKETMGYLSWVKDSASSMRGGSEYHELSVMEYQNFIDTYIRPNPSCPTGVADELSKIANYFITAAKRDMGKAAGTIVPKRRNELFIQLYEDNKETIYNKIRTRTKKSIIFSTMVPVIKHIASDMNQIGIGNVVITGETKDRLALLNRFREDPNCLVLIATSWCMGTGVTLTNASQMFFFGAPWRSTDYEQAWSRIWRIGQTDPVDVYNVRMVSRKQNLSDRMSKILEWSDKMFNASISANAIDGVSEEEMKSAAPATESYRQMTTFEILTSMMRALKDYDYGMFYQGKIQDPTDKTLYDKYYRTLSPGKFTKVKGGICFDYAAYQDFYCKAHSLACDNYFLEVFGGDEKNPIYQTHAFTVVRDGVFQLVYPERAFAETEGVWKAKDLSEIVSFILNHMTKSWKNRDIDFKLYSLRTRWGFYDETMNEFLTRARSGKQIPITWNKHIWELEPYEDVGDNDYVIESFTFNDRIDSPQYDCSISETELKVLSLIRDIYEDLDPSKANPLHAVGEWTDNLERYYINPIGWDYEYYDTAHFYSPWDCAKYLHDEMKKRGLDPICVCLLITPEDERYTNPILMPVITLPFGDGALYIERGISPRRNRIYFAKSISEIANYAVYWTLDYLHKSTLVDFEECVKDAYRIPESVWNLIPSCLYEPFLDEIKKGAHINIKWEKPNEDLWRVEVLNHGWIVERF